MLPWPDNFFLSTTWNPNAVPGLTITNASLPLDNSGNAIDPAAGGWTGLKGFAPLPQITAYLPGLSLELSGLPRLWNISASLSSPQTVPSLILDAETLQPVMHWAELDESSPPSGNPSDEQRALLLWPAAALEYGRTYIVALRNLVDSAGDPVAPSDGFAALLWNRSANNPALQASRPRFERIFAALEAYDGSGGWSRSQLTLAWDFTVNSQADITGQFVAMRDDAFKRVGGGAELEYSIAAVTESPAPTIARMIQGWFMAPRYINQEGPGENVRLVVDPSTGLPVYQSMMPVNFTVLIPASLAGNATTPPRTGKALHFGHGLFGFCACSTPGGGCSPGEIADAFMEAEADANGWVMGCINWIGMAQEDELVAAAMLATDITDFAFIPDRLHQGILHGLLVTKLMTQSPFAKDPATVYDGVPVISTAPGDVHYYGSSNGGIYGAVIMAVSTDITRGVSGVPGTPYAMLLPRSSDFADLFDIVRARYASPIDIIALLALIQERWTRMEPSGYARAISRELLPGTPPHTILIHHGLGDAQVSWLGAHTLARSAGSASASGLAHMFASNVAEGNETLSGFAFVPDNATISGVGANAIMTFQYQGVPEVPFVNIPASSATDTHEYPRRTPQSQAQMAHFFATGEIVNTCGGACANLPVP